MKAAVQCNLVNWLTRVRISVLCWVVQFQTIPPTITAQAEFCRNRRKSALPSQSSDVKWILKIIVEIMGKFKNNYYNKYSRWYAVCFAIQYIANLVWTRLNKIRSKATTVMIVKWMSELRGSLMTGGLGIWKPKLGQPAKNRGKDRRKLLGLFFFISVIKQTHTDLYSLVCFAQQFNKKSSR